MKQNEQVRIGEDGTAMEVREFVVNNQLGIHARPAALLVKTASRYTSEITLHKEDISVSAKSIIGVLTLEGHTGVKLRVSAQGEDATEALDALQALFESNFNEE